MKIMRRILGVLVMIAGILGVLLSLTGLVGLWWVKPILAQTAKDTVDTLIENVNASQEVMQITSQALSATIDSVDALSAMLNATATTVEDTEPLLEQVNTLMSDTVPSTLGAATESLKTAQQAATVLDSAIVSIEKFQQVISAVPLLSVFVEKPRQTYNPQVPLADSLGELAANLESLPPAFTEMSISLDKADDQMETIRDNLTTMADSARLISKSLADYQAMVSQSRSSLEELEAILANIQGNLDNILNWTAILLTFFLLWLLAAQVVILTQGWELYQGTADRMEGIDPQT